MRLENITLSVVLPSQLSGASSLGSQPKLEEGGRNVSPRGALDRFSGTGCLEL
jgi:hypothetical protein